jgi:hypothetical protein
LHRELSDSCDQSVQNDFERAVAMIHSLWYDEAEKAFSAVWLALVAPHTPVPT